MSRNLERRIAPMEAKAADPLAVDPCRGNQGTGARSKVSERQALRHGSAFLSYLADDEPDDPPPDPA